jgi:uncharacterized protein YwgA
VKITFPWHKCGLISDIALKCSEHGTNLGKTALQKLIYLLQELQKVDVGYEFSLHNYGPFSAELQADLDLVESLRGVNVNASEYGWEIVPGSKCEALRQKANEFLSEQMETAIRNVIDEFGGYPTKKLELISTIIFADREFQRTDHSSKVPRSKLVSLVHEIKPHFSENKISEVITELENKGFLEKRK